MDLFNSITTELQIYNKNLSEHAVFEPQTIRTMPKNLGFYPLRQCGGMHNMTPLLTMFHPLDFSRFLICYQSHGKLQ